MKAAFSSCCAVYSVQDAVLPIGVEYGKSSRCSPDPIRHTILVALSACGLGVLPWCQIQSCLISGVSEYYQALPERSSFAESLDHIQFPTTVAATGACSLSSFVSPGAVAASKNALMKQAEGTGRLRRPTPVAHAPTKLMMFWSLQARMRSISLQKLCMLMSELEASSLSNLMATSFELRPSSVALYTCELYCVSTRQGCSSMRAGDDLSYGTLPGSPAT